MKIKKNFFNILLTIIFLNIKTGSIASTNSKIVASVENQIISSYELKNKIKTILFLSNQNLNQENINLTKRPALEKLIDYKLKENQIKKFNIQSNYNNQINNYLNNLSLKYKTDINGVKKIFKNNSLDFELHLNEIETEFKWQKLIYNRFKNKVFIDKNEVDNDLNNFIKTQNNFKEYKLAEIEIPLKNNSEDKKTILEVNNQIQKIGFKEAAIKYSISTSSLEGGDIGWISSKSLSNEILSIVDQMKVGSVSKPIVQTNTLTLIKLLDKRTKNVDKIDLKELRQKIINNKKNELLKLYSNNYLSKIRNNALIEIR